MIRQETSSDTQPRYVRNTDYFTPDDLRQPAAPETYKPDFHKYDHLIPPAEKALKFTAKATWFMMKMLVKAAFKIPRLVSRVHAAAASKDKSKKRPSPTTAFPAP